MKKWGNTLIKANIKDIILWFRISHKRKCIQAHHLFAPGHKTVKLSTNKLIYPSVWRRWFGQNATIHRPRLRCLDRASARNKSAILLLFRPVFGVASIVEDAAYATIGALVADPARRGRRTKIRCNLCGIISCRDP